MLGRRRRRPPRSSDGIILCLPGTGVSERRGNRRGLVQTGIVWVWVAFPPPFSAALMGLSPARSPALRSFFCGRALCATGCGIVSVGLPPHRQARMTDRFGPAPTRVFSCGSPALCATDNASAALRSWVCRLTGKPCSSLRFEVADILRPRLT
jgi:hypothetical protein